MSSFPQEFDDMDGYDWVNFIDEYHCTDYWVDIDELENRCDMQDECDPGDDEED